MPPFPPSILSFTVWGLAAALYLLAFFHRVAPAVLTNELMAEFSLGAAALGNLSAFYFYSYVAMQIPTGVLVDHWGPRRVLTVGAAIAACGTLLFAIPADFAWVGLGRLLIGASVGVAFVAMLKLSTHWFAASHFAALAGGSLACGIIGAVSAGAPLRLAADAFGWRNVMIAAAAITGVLAVVIWLAVRDDPRERGYRSHVPDAHAAGPGHSMLGGVARVLRSRNMWQLFIINGGVTGPVLTFAGLWGVPFLVAHYGLSTASAATICSVLLLSWAAAGPPMGVLSDRMRARKPLYAGGALLATLGWGLVFLLPGLPLALLITILVCTGIVSATVMIGFAYAKESAPAALAGTTSGVINMGNMIGGMVMQPAVGWMLDRYWDGTMRNGARLYDFAAFRAGFSLMLVWLVVAVVLALTTRDTHCRQHP